MFERYSATVGLFDVCLQTSDIAFRNNQSEIVSVAYC